MKQLSINTKSVLTLIFCVGVAMAAVLFAAHRTNAANITLTGNVTFAKNLAITGALSKSSGTFAIDDPIDPSNKILFHSFVESPEAKNLYDGIATLDAAGEATIDLPVYFTALNKDFRYQYAPVGEAMPNLYIKHQILETNLFDNKFVIAGGVPNGTISWQVTGNRHDPYMVLHPIVPVVDKGPGQPVKKGVCLFAPLCD